MNGTSRPRREWARRLSLAGGTLAAAVLVAAGGADPLPVRGASVLIPAAAGTLAADTSATLPLDAVALEAEITELREEMLVPGVVVYLRTPYGRFTLKQGATEYGSGPPIRFNDHIRIGSVTKTLTGTAILQLVDEGKLALDDPVGGYVPGVPDGDAITIRQLLEMRTGLYNYALDPELNRIMDEEPGRNWAPAELLAIAFSHPVQFAPGEAFQYSNTNTVLLGLIAEQLDDKPLGEIFEDRFFEPLGMSESSYPDGDDRTLPDPHPQGYMFGTNVSTINTAKLSPEDLAAAQAGTLLPNNFTELNPSWAGAAGAGISTMKNLVTWVDALNGGDLLSPGLQAERLSSLRPTSDDAPAEAPLYGMALAKFGPLIGHTGELPGYNTFAGSDPDNGVTLVVWTNLAPSPQGLDPASTIAKAIVEMVYPPAG